MNPKTTTENPEKIEPKSTFCEGKCTAPILGGGWSPVTMADLVIIGEEYYCSHCQKKLDECF